MNAEPTQFKPKQFATITLDRRYGVDFGWDMDFRGNFHEYSGRFVKLSNGWVNVELHTWCCAVTWS